MRTKLTQDEIQRYRTNGYLVVEQLLEPSELEHWRGAIDAAIAENLVQQPEGSNPKVFTERMNLRHVSPAVKALVEEPGIGRLIADLEDMDAARIYLDQALVKESYSLPTQYHLDLPWWAFDSDHACTIWIALDDSTVENGCLYFIPGSHDIALTHRSDLGPDLGVIFDAHPEIEPAPVPAPIPAGGCTFHNSRTIHGAGANMTAGRRRAMTAAFMPDGVRFDGTKDLRTLGGEYLNSLRKGDLLQNDDLSPVTFARQD